jgi:hypothetical protein
MLGFGGTTYHRVEWSGRACRDPGAPVARPSLMMARTKVSIESPLAPELARRLAQRLMDGQLALFVGAGISHLAATRGGSGRRLPLWQELAQGVAERCQEDQASYRDVLDLFDAIALGQERAVLERAVREMLDDREVELSPAHRALGGCRGRRCSRPITTACWRGRGARARSGTRTATTGSATGSGRGSSRCMGPSSARTR